MRWASCRQLQDAVGEDACTQTATALQPVLGTRAQGGVHPVTRLALLHAGKPDALDFELGANQRIQIHSRDKSIAPSGGGLGVG
jgi:hypothetical protein